MDLILLHLFLKWIPKHNTMVIIKIMAIHFSLYNVRPTNLFNIVIFQHFKCHVSFMQQTIIDGGLCEVFTNVG
jgi:hypothetical protein